MRKSAVVVIALGLAALGGGEAFAGGFLKGLVGRATVRGVGAAVGSSSSSSSSASTSSSSAAAKSYGADILTVDQLAACLKSASDLDGASQKIDTERGALEARISGVDARRAKLEETKAKLNRSSQAAVDRHNAQIKDYDKLVGETKAKQNAFNERVRAQNARVDGYNGQCAKRYYVDDLAAAKQKANVAF
jgi:chromosome segregation ATPase